MINYWSEREKAYVKEFYGRVPLCSIAARIGRSEKAVYQQFLKMNGEPWRESKKRKEAEYEVFNVDEVLFRGNFSQCAEFMGVTKSEARRMLKSPATAIDEEMQIESVSCIYGREE